MKFLLGVITGAVLGAAGAVLYSVSTGRDLREEYAGVRDEVMRRDFDALSSRLESRFTELQTTVQDRVGQMQSSGTNGHAAEAVDEVQDAASDAIGQAESAAEDAGEKIEDAAQG